jgi:hypothetical protein
MAGKQGKVCLPFSPQIDSIFEFSLQGKPKLSKPWRITMQVEMSECPVNLSIISLLIVALIQTGPPGRI